MFLPCKFRDFLLLAKTRNVDADLLIEALPLLWYSAIELPRQLESFECRRLAKIS
jgi:hypothetical protein